MVSIDFKKFGKSWVKEMWGKLQHSHKRSRVSKKVMTARRVGRWWRYYNTRKTVGKLGSNHRNHTAHHTRNTYLPHTKQHGPSCCITPPHTLPKDSPFQGLCTCVSCTIHTPTHSAQGHPLPGPLYLCVDLYLKPTSCKKDFIFTYSVLHVQASLLTRQGYIPGDTY